MQNLDREQPKIVSWTVFTVGENARTDNYPLPQTPADATRFAMSIEAIITGALSGESMVLRLANPMVSYSAAHIISIAFDSFGQSS